MSVLRLLRPVAVQRGILARPPSCRPAACSFSSPAVLHFRRRYSAAAPSYDRACEIHPDGLKFNLPADLALAGAKQQRDKLSFMWLRDNCRCSKCVNPDTTQRAFATFKLPLDIRPIEARADKAGVHVTWSDNHQSQYAWNFLQQYLYHGRRKEKTIKKTLWGAEIAKNPPVVPYGHVLESDDGVAKVTANLTEYGVCFIDEVPYDDPNDTKTLLERIAFIRVTHYGGFYDFTPNLAMADTAYTNLALPAHTDTTYFTDPAGLQAFHLLSHKPIGGGQGQGQSEPLGGESLLVDGFHAAQVLRAEDEAAYDVLSRVGLPWHASGNKGITIAPDKLYPVLEHKASGRLHRIRWNNDDRGVVPLTSEFPSGEEISADEWYAAARKFDEILRRKDMEYWFQLRPGRVVVFDNWRVLHGRNAFQGIRRICGAYINRDDWISRWLNTNYPREEVLDAVRG